MATSRLFVFLRPSILRSSTPLPKFNIICRPHSLRLKRYNTTSSLTLDSDASSTHDPPSALSSHPWPEWIDFVDRLKVKGYITHNSSLEDEGSVDYTDMKSVKDACLSFARDRFDIFKSLSTQDLHSIVDKGCPNLLRKAVNSAKRLRAYVGLDEADVCGSCNLRGSCDRAYVMLNESESSARTVDVVRILLLYALDPLVISGESKPSDKEVVESTVRKLLSELVELGEKPVDPDLPKPASIAPQRKKQPLDVSYNKNSRNVDMKQGDWVCITCNFMNYARNLRCLRCKAESPRSETKSAVEMKKGDWNCPGCSFMNFASNKQCFRCHAPRPQRELKPGDWECPDCDFLNYSRNTVCKKCNLDRPRMQNNQESWKKPY